MYNCLQPKKRKRPEIKLVLGDNGCKEDEEGEEALERRAKEEKDVANRHKRDRLMLLDSQSSAASGDKSTSSLSAPNRTAATPSGTRMMPKPTFPSFL